MKSGDKIKVTAGIHAGRAGEFLKNCSVVFADHCRVKLDIKGRERENKQLMILKSQIEPA